MAAMCKLPIPKVSCAQAEICRRSGLTLRCGSQGFLTVARWCGRDRDSLRCRPIGPRIHHNDSHKHWNVKPGRATSVDLDAAVIYIRFLFP